MTPRDLIPPDWAERLGSGPLGLGVDLGTTTKQTSNPSALVVTEAVGDRRVEHLVLAWKTDVPEVTFQIVEMIVRDARRCERAFRRAAIDASNETFFAKLLRTRLLGLVPVDLVKGGEKVQWQGEDYIYKTLLNLLYAELYEQNCISIPNLKWISDDRRLVKKEGGGFITEMGESGAHGDTFDAGKLAHWSLIKGRGSVAAAAAAVGQWGQKLLTRTGVRAPFAKHHQHRAAKTQL